MCAAGIIEGMVKKDNRFIIILAVVDTVFSTDAPARLPLVEGKEVWAETASNP